MATIRELPSGKVNVQVRREGHPPLTATFPNRTEAKAWARKIEGDIDQGKHCDGASDVERQHRLALPAKRQSARA